MKIRDRHVIAIALFIQAVCALFFLFDLLSSIFSFRSEPIPWQLREVIEIGAVFGLVLGFALGAFALRRATQKRRHVEGQLGNPPIFNGVRL